MSKNSHKLGVILVSFGIQKSGVSVGESSMSSSSIMTRVSSDEESLLCPSSMQPPWEKKKPGLEIDLSGPGLRSRFLHRSLGPSDLRPDLTCVFSGTPDLRPDLTWGCAETPNLQVRSRSQVQVSGHDIWETEGC